MTFLPPPPPKYQLYYRKLVVKTLPQQSKQDAKNQLFFRFPHKSIETKRKGKHVKCGLARFSVTFMDGFMPPRLCFFFTFPRVYEICCNEDSTHIPLFSKFLSESSLLPSWGKFKNRKKTILALPTSPLQEEAFFSKRFFSTNISWSEAN